MQTVPQRLRKAVAMLTALLFSLLSASHAPAAPKLTAEGAKATIESDRYLVVIEGLAITRIENKLTGEKYAAPTAATSHSTAERVLLS